MLVKVSAFDTTIASEMHDRESFTKELVTLSGQQIENRKYYFDATSFPGFCVGVIITIKDQAKFCSLESFEGGKSKIVVNNLNEHEKIMDFNFFAIQISNGIGVYQHYHQSAALSTLRWRLKQVGREVSEAGYCELLAASGKTEDKATKSFIAKLRKKAKIKVSVTQIISKDSLQKILEAYKKIKALEYVYTILTDEVKNATPLSGRIYKKQEKIYFNNNEVVDTLAYEIQQAVNKLKFSRGQVIVEDNEDVTRAIKIFDMPEFLWESEYDTVVEDIADIDPGDFSSNKFLSRLVSLFEDDEYAHILMVEI